MDDAIQGACQELAALPAWRRIRSHLLHYAASAGDSGVRAGRYDVIGLVDRYADLKPKERPKHGR